MKIVRKVLHFFGHMGLVFVIFLCFFVGIIVLWMAAPNALDSPPEE